MFSILLEGEQGRKFCRTAEGWSKKVQSEFYWNASDLSRTFMFSVNGNLKLNKMEFYDKFVIEDYGMTNVNQLIF